MNELSDFKKVCEEAAYAAGAVLLDWAGRFQVREKGPSDLVTEADLASQEIIRERLLSAFPGHGFLAEENASIPSRDQGYRWIVDPLDGTTNYVHGIPCYAVSIALERSGELLIGAIYDPVAKEMYMATVGEGAFCNGQRLRVSDVKQLSQAVVSMSLPPKPQRNDPELQHFMDVVTRAQSVRRIGSATMAMNAVAAGRFDGYWSINTKIWDVAAGVLIIREAGGLVTGVHGEPFDLDHPHFLAASTPALHEELRSALHEPPAS